MHRWIRSRALRILQRCRRTHLRGVRCSFEEPYRRQQSNQSLDLDHCRMSEGIHLHQARQDDPMSRRRNKIICRQCECEERERRQIQRSRVLRWQPPYEQSHDREPSRALVRELSASQNFRNLRCAVLSQHDCDLEGAQICLCLSWNLTASIWSCLQFPHEERPQSALFRWTESTMTSLGKEKHVE